MADSDTTQQVTSQTPATKQKNPKRAAAAMATYTSDSFTNAEEAMSYLLKNPTETYYCILRLILKIGEKDWPICSKVHVFSSVLDFVKSAPELIQCVGEDRIKFFEEKLKSIQKKIGPHTHTRGCSMCDPWCFAPPMQYFNTCSMLANRTGRHGSW